MNSHALSITAAIFFLLAILTQFIQLSLLNPDDPISKQTQTIINWRRRLNSFRYLCVLMGLFLGCLALFNMRGKNEKIHGTHMAGLVIFIILIVATQYNVYLPFAPSTETVTMPLIQLQPSTVA